ncbi:ATP-binding protein [Edaphobacter bradus]|uniref:ATP-binding protein n=1 Tax=Edaphobacter bradus TaxID=2259016 RepID=UPI0021DFF1F4|nr:ATP-binding protein [Edaphobacter bradus]
MSEQTQIVPSQQINEALFAKLRKAPILSSVKDDDIRCLKGVEEVCLEAGDFLARQGEAAHYFWILLEGDITFYQTTPEGEEIALTSVSAGHSFGEVPLLANIPNAASLRAAGHCCLAQLDEDSFWNLMTTCPGARTAILSNMASRIQKLQSFTVQKEKMASLGTLAAGLMHELNNPGTAARRAASQLRENLLRLHEISARFSKTEMTHEQKECMFDLQEHALAGGHPVLMNSIEQSDAEEALAEWLEAHNIENAWKMAPTLVSAGLSAHQLECAQHAFSGSTLSDALSWLDALVSSMQLVGTIEESIGRVSDLIYAVKSYAYEGKAKNQAVDVNKSIHATLVILGHKLREKEIVLEKDFAADLPPLLSDGTGLNQIWTNLLDNAIDALPQGGRIGVRTWAEKASAEPAHSRTDICISISDNGLGIPIECQAHIFDPFYTTKPIGVGTGIGLGIVHRIVEQYHGSIHFSSMPGNTEFVVRIPSATPEK